MRKKISRIAANCEERTQYRRLERETVRTIQQAAEACQYFVSMALNQRSNGSCRLLIRGAGPLETIVVVRNTDGTEGDLEL
jgi:redox-regulated HSP33 family molecular chaperone